MERVSKDVVDLAATLLMIDFLFSMGDNHNPSDCAGRAERSFIVIYSPDKLKARQNDKHQYPVAQHLPRKDPAEKDPPLGAKGAGSDEERQSQDRNARKDEGERSPSVKKGLEPLPWPALKAGVVVKDGLCPALAHIVGDQTPGGPPGADQEDEYPKPVIEQSPAEKTAWMVVLREPQYRSYHHDHGHQFEQQVHAPKIRFGSVLARIGFG